MKKQKSQNKESKKQEYKIKIKYVYSDSPDAEERLNKAFDILFRDIDLSK